MDEDASSSEATGPAAGLPGAAPDPAAGPPAPPAPAVRARYRPLRPIEELIDDVLGRTG
ncbi:hypothetical protein [Actinomycetospora straminea]|uniref:Uncharacterized protein n=1 Tax=Actinomycetospora straminea TaxID=663607 RepID=A0ABP9EK61_9PSEU|nr:hypothetical protein [Actinomycetospora straminea]MDD7933194.1 hypothetical protein [Actinomycetospora straminea]